MMPMSQKDLEPATQTQRIAGKKTASADSAVNDTTREVVRKVKGNKGRRKWFVVVGVGTLLASATVVYLLSNGEEQTKSYRTVAASRGDIVTTATATGNLQPGSEVAIGSEISGRIESVSVDFNDRVKKGQELARFATIDLENEVDQAELSLEAARADLRRANATLDEAKSEEARLKQLAKINATPKAQLDSAKATTARASADVFKSRTSLEIAKARVVDVKNDLNKAILRSPVDGVVMTRSVEPGNTVASSLQSPELFVLAEDLSKMELHVAIDEADVGQVKAGDTATFTVDAWPDETFDASVQIVHLSPTMNGNVVTYTAVLTVDNSKGLLRPGMTAMATINTDIRSDVLRIPAAALRYEPTVEKEEGFSLVAAPRRRWRRDNNKGTGNTIYVLRNGQPERIAVKVGRSDGRLSELLEGELAEGDEIIVGERAAGEGGGEGRSSRGGARSQSGSGDNDGADGRGNRGDRGSRGGEGGGDGRSGGEP